MTRASWTYFSPKGTLSPYTNFFRASSWYANIASGHKYDLCFLDWGSIWSCAGSDPASHGMLDRMSWDSEDLQYEDLWRVWKWQELRRWKSYKGDTSKEEWRGFERGTRWVCQSAIDAWVFRKKKNKYCSPLISFVTLLCIATDRWETDARRYSLDIGLNDGTLGILNQFGPYLKEWQFNTEADAWIQARMKKIWMFPVPVTPFVRQRGRGSM